jgi:hypothetical protein
MRHVFDGSMKKTCRLLYSKHGGFGFAIFEPWSVFGVFGVFDTPLRCLLTYFFKCMTIKKIAFAFAWRKTSWEIKFRATFISKF